MHRRCPIMALRTVMNAVVLRGFGAEKDYAMTGLTACRRGRDRGKEGGKKRGPREQIICYTSRESVTSTRSATGGSLVMNLVPALIGAGVTGK